MKRHTDKFADLATEAMHTYHDFKARSGGSLANMSDADVARALELHDVFCDLDTCSREPERVRCNVAAVQRAIDFGGDVLETDSGRAVVFGATVVYGSVESLRELAQAVIEGADEGAQLRADYAEREVPQEFVERWAQASLDAAAKIIDAVAEEVVL